ncbi:hypothetical protein [Streptomyces megasporus]|uniref:hypothetical protein n=1 Tax=Streptomyces megasporus TaxID=44060 RepID=UPI0006923EA9|nr:hypothetical protein [Streptomyces megasporus]
MEPSAKTGSGHLDRLAEATVVAACELADAVEVERWSAGAVEDAACALEVLAGALGRLDPESADILSVVPVAVAALLERTEQAHAEAAAPDGEEAGGATVTGTELRRALAFHGITRSRVHRLGPALVTVTLAPADAQALAALLLPRGALPRRARPVEAEELWGGGPARTAAAALAEALVPHGVGTYARVLGSGQVSAGLTPQAARSVVAALTSSSAPRPRRRGLGPGYMGLNSGGR